MVRRPRGFTHYDCSAASEVYKGQVEAHCAPRLQSIVCALRTADEVNGSATHQRHVAVLEQEIGKLCQLVELMPMSQDVSTCVFDDEGQRVRCSPLVILPDDSLELDVEKDYEKVLPGGDETDEDEKEGSIQQDVEVVTSGIVTGRDGGTVAYQDAHSPI